MTKKVAFYDVKEATYQGGFSVSEIIKKLGISKRTWYRWQEKKEAPYWAYLTINILSGDLSELGMKGYYIKDSVIYNRDLNPKYYNWNHADLMVTVFCKCNSHLYLRTQRQDIASKDEKTRNQNVSIQGRTRQIGAQRLRKRGHGTN